MAGYVPLSCGDDENGDNSNDGSKGDEEGDEEGDEDEEGDDESGVAKNKLDQLHEEWQQSLRMKRSESGSASVLASESSSRVTSTAAGSSSFTSTPKDSKARTFTATSTMALAMQIRARGDIEVDPVAPRVAASEDFAMSQNNIDAIKDCMSSFSLPCPPGFKSVCGTKC